MIASPPLNDDGASPLQSVTTYLRDTVMLPAERLAERQLKQLLRESSLEAPVAQRSLPSNELSKDLLLQKYLSQDSLSTRSDDAYHDNDEVLSEPLVSPTNLLEVEDILHDDQTSEIHSFKKSLGIYSPL